MHPAEEWFPSSVSFFEQYATLSQSGDRYETKQALREPSTFDWQGAEGQKPDANSVPIYAFVVDGKLEGPDTFTDLVYFTFYPYNRGKKVVDTMWGNHVGDWEHLTIRFSKKGNAYTPVKISFSQHDKNQVIGWGEPGVELSGQHLIAYEAFGSHGLYPGAGKHTYKDFVLAKLSDVTGKGMPWDTWNNVVTATRANGKWSCTGHDGQPNAEDCSRWMNYPAAFRWGNAKRGTCKFGECQLNDGPTTMSGKTAVVDLNTFD